MANTFGSVVSICKGLAVPTEPAWDALSSVLREYRMHPGMAVLTIDLTELKVPFQAKVSVPVTIETSGSAGGSKYETRLTISAAAKHGFFPSFSGIIELVAQPAYKCQLRLDGKYSVPFKIFGKMIDETVLRGVAEKSLQAFIDQLAKDISERVQHDEVEYARRSRGINT